MSELGARETILHAVRAARPPAVSLPAPRIAPALASGQPSLLDAFAAAAMAAGAAVVIATRDEVSRLALGADLTPRNVLSTVAEVRTTVPPSQDPHALDSLDLFVADSPLGVAENGAVWVATSDVMHRAALFLATRVVIVVDAGTIVPTLHDAYARIDVRAHPFGAFVAGPSKTADIEQSLVIGAHGPKELTVIVIGTNGESGAQQASRR
jgi:L-lactate dehydrogenase complex protein LldG